MTVTDTATASRTGGMTGAARARLAGHGFTLGVFAACELVLLAWWLAFFPVLVTPDSITYVYEATTNHWATDHSVVYDAAIWLSLQTTHGVGLLTLLQTIALAAVLAYIAGGLRQLGANAWVTAIVPVLVLLSPSLGSFPVYLWKDVPFTICGLWLIGLLIRFVVLSRESGWASSTRARVLGWWTFAAVLLMCLSRNNAFVFTVIAAAVLLVLWRRASLRIIAMMAVGVIAATLLTVAVFPLFGVQRAKSDLVLGPAYDDVAYFYLHEPRVFSTSDLSLLSSVAPLPVWHHAGNCYTADDLTNDPRFSRDAASAHSGQLFALWRRILVHHPAGMTYARLCRGYIAWSPVPAPKRLGQTVFPLTIEKPSRYLKLSNLEWRRALMPAPIDRGYRHFAQVYDVYSRPDEWAIWRGATWCYVLYAAIAVAVARTRRWSLIALAAVPFGVQLGVLLDNPNQLVRYMMVPLYAGAVLLPVVTVPRRRTAVGETASAPPAPPPQTPPQPPADPAPADG